jgi:hypothetical protein
MNTVTDIPKKGPLSEFRPTFTKYVMAFGVTVIATEKIDKLDIQHVVGVLAQFLDNDQDGNADNGAGRQLAIRNSVIAMT